MSRGPILFLGIFFALALSWFGLVLAPQLQIGSEGAVPIGSIFYPPLRPGQAQEGKQVYQANGCGYCHTQYVLAANLGSDLERGWGRRPSVDQDYLNETPALLGLVRLGPDLTNIGQRQTNEIWHLVHLYDPRLTSPGSTMPRYSFLFLKRKAGAEPSPEALPVPETDQTRGYEIIPKPEARQLAAYLMSLESDVPLFEAPIPQPPAATNAPAGTNAPPSASTNAAAAGATNALLKSGAGGGTTNAASTNLPPGTAPGIRTNAPK